MHKKLFAVLMLAFFAVGCSDKPSLVIYTWSGMFPAEVISGFENDTGIRIRYVNFDYNETMLARLTSERRGNYDLVIADDYILENVILEGLAQKIDITRLSNYGNINPFYQQQFYDPTDEYTIPYGAGVQTIVYDQDLTGMPIRGYTDLLHPALVNRIGIIDNYRVINGMALKMMGQSYNTNDPDVIRRAGEYLRTFAPNIRLIRDDRLDDELLAGEISAAVMYTDMVTRAKMERPELQVVFPAEGIGFGIMAAFIPSNAPNADAAYLFLDYILDAERGAGCFEYLGYYSTFSASDPYINEEYRDFLTLPEDFWGFTSMEMIQNVNDEARSLHNLIWTEFKSAAGQ
ncbi:MAG: spermidine/putrescine ABC transporter substrate-binding protein [Treponema sp.]|nr:spermidine/putrescine ABC transporter substrate-binding protein [Treponema sp.]